jgi:hypothetical protein
MRSIEYQDLAELLLAGRVMIGCAFHRRTTTLVAGIGRYSDREPAVRSTAEWSGPRSSEDRAAAF